MKLFWFIFAAVLINFSSHSHAESKIPYALSAMLGDEKAGLSSREDLASVFFAQTHVMPHQGIKFNLAGFSDDEQRHLKLAGNRETLVIVDMNVEPFVNEKIYLQIVSSCTNQLYLMHPPISFPVTEENGEKFKENAFWYKIAGIHIKPGLRVRIVGHSEEYGTRILNHFKEVQVGSSPKLVIRPVNFYFFDSTPQNYPTPLVFNLNVTREYFAKVPVSKVEVQRLPDIVLDYLVIPPDVIDLRARATILTNTDDIRDFPRRNGPTQVSLRMLWALQEANGEKQLPHFYYGATHLKYSDGTPWFGGGGGPYYENVSTGDPHYGVFHHEIGHNFGMPHANAAYNAKTYPYVGGSLLGSAWGFDSIRNIFLAPFVPARNEFEPPINCVWRGTTLQRDELGRCIKQDPMQGGAGLQSPNDRFAMFSDFNAAEVQWAIEGKTTLDESGKHIHSSERGGLVERDYDYQTGLKRWDSIYKRYVEFHPAKGPKNSSYGWGKALPVKWDVPVYSFIITLSTDPRPEFTQIYPPLYFKGNLIEYIDPTDADDLASIDIAEGKNKHYCNINGCDYTLRVTYEDDQKLYRLIPKGFRVGPINPDPYGHDPTHWASMFVIAVNVPGEMPLKKVELLETPLAFLRDMEFFKTAPVLFSRDL